MEEEIDKVKTWSDENVQAEVTDDKPEEVPAKEEKPEDNPLEGEEKHEGNPEDGNGDKAEPKKDAEGDIAKGFGVEGHTPKGVQERFNEMSRSNRELKERNAALEARIKALEEAAPKPKEKDRNDFANDEEWINHLASKKAEEMFSKNIADWEFKKEMESATPLMKKREAEARSKLADFDTVMSQNVDLPVDRETFLYVAKSEKSAMINYTLRKVPAIRQQFVNTPVNERLNFIKGVEKRIEQIEAEVAAKNNQNVQPEAAPKGGQPSNEIRLPQGNLRQPMEVRHKPSTRPDPATCSMDEWMDNGD